LPVASARFVTGHGIEGDAHAGPWHRQVSLLATESIELARLRLPEIAAGDFAENLAISGIEPDSLGLGSRLRLGAEVEIRITQIGKVCHNPCRIQSLTGDCIMPRRGLFARVENGGAASVGDTVALVHLVPRHFFQVVVLTISDRCSQGQATDTAGPAVVRQIMEGMEANVYAAEILPDEAQRIADRLKHYSYGHSIDLILTVGGTGFSPRDVTPEATRGIVERLTPGLDEAMRAASAAKTPHAMLSRASSGIRGATLIVNLPGSERGARENLEAIMPALPHGLAKLRGDAADCGRSGVC
jgi:molybdenum cofactor synthesis domain-containing protein